MMPSTSMNGGGGIGIAQPSMAFVQVPEGKFQDAIKILSHELNTFPRSRAAYEQLVRTFPEVDDYRLYYAQSLYKSGQYQPAQKACQTVETPEYSQKLIKLQAAIKYEMDDLPGCKQLIEQCQPDEPDTIVNQACLLYKEGKYEEACIKYAEALKISGYNAELSYNLALCHYQMKQFVPALKAIADIIERGIRDHPELSVGMATEGIEVRSVGNSQVLHETYLVEAFNLKAAIEYRLRNFEAAREALTDMPPRLEQELDPVSLHNQALMNMDEDPTGGFEKLNFLLQQPPTPPEAFGNLLLLYVKYEYYDLAADLLAENSAATYNHLNTYLFDYLEAILLKQSSPEEAFKKLDDLANKHVEILRKLTKQVQEARQNMDEEAVKKVVNDYDDAVERYIPVLMAQAKIYWDMENYSMVEKIFRKSVEFCNEHDVWKLNVAHVLFMQESKYKEAISFYEPIVKKHYENILDVTAIVLANLCVSRKLMRKIEKEEERVAYEDPNKRTYHLCIVNLVIGTLYCAKGNYEFGISRIMKSLEPFNKKLGTDTWYYAKRCFASLFETLAKHMILLKDTVFAEALAFFDACELHGRNIPVVIDPMGVEGIDPAKNSVAYEARLLKSLFLRLYE
ncbi:tetratricopeptide repeat protein 30B [Chytridium lagenaria]|nr:tetratricopeptide repeat protein 30B [Chytridium lagenaria]